MITDVAVLCVASTFCLSHLFLLEHSLPVVSCGPRSLTPHGRCFSRRCVCVGVGAAEGDICVCASNVCV